MNTRLVETIQEEIKKLGSQEAVAAKCGISGASLSQYLNGKYGADVKNIENKLIIGLSFRVNSEWKIAQTRDLKALMESFENARVSSTFLAVSEKAGSGKTACITAYEKGKTDVYVVRAREWTGRMFLDELIRITGTRFKETGYINMDAKIKGICNFIQERRDKHCQIIIDEADKLRPSALGLLIPLYNKCEDILSVVICGTPNLKKEIENGVKFSRKGYDEIDSRFGRKYISLDGAFKGDVKAICTANGMEDPEKIEAIWKKMPKVRKAVEGKDYEVVVDMRLLKREIKVTLL